MAPGGTEKAHFERFGALATKWSQEAPRRLIFEAPGPAEARIHVKTRVFTRECVFLRLQEHAEQPFRALKWPRRPENTGFYAFLREKHVF